MTDVDLAVVDRIVDGTTAVLLLEADETVVDEYTLECARLPEDGRHEGAVFDVELEEAEGELRELRYRPELEEQRRETAQERFDRLSERLPDE